MKISRSHSHGRHWRQPPSMPPRAWTLPELLVTLTIIALLLSLLVPAGRRARQRAQGTHCLNNLRQIQFAWLLYLDDHRDHLPPNEHGPVIRDRQPGRLSWVGGWLDWTARGDNTNTLLLNDPAHAAMARYFTASAPLFKCPGDRSQSQANPGPRIRSYAMNAALGAGLGKTNTPSRNTPPVTTHRSELAAPSETWVLIDEHPDSLNDACFFVDFNAPRWLDLPASHHDGAGTISFADGHVESPRWLEPGTRRPVRTLEGDYHAFFPRGQRDLAWLRARTPGQRNVSTP